MPALVTFSKLLAALRIPSALILIIVNLIPLAGVIFLGWNIFSLILLYWLESAVIGFYNIFKIIKVDPKKSAFLVPFFMFHYGMFMFVHLVFIFVIFSGVARDGIALSILWALLGMIISHGLSYRFNFLGKKEYLNKEPNLQVMQPYPRIIVMHLTVMVAAWIAIMFDASLATLIVMIIIKIALDLLAHLKEHHLIAL